MKTLPAELADPLHVLQPFPWRTLAALAALAAAVLLIWLWRRLRRRLRERPAPVPEPASRPVAGLPAFGEVIEKIQIRYLNADRRRGCHELSSALRGHYEGRTAGRLATSTVNEMTRTLGETPLTRLFGLLADLQFGRREPSRGDFEGICELARDVVRSGDAA